MIPVMKSQKFQVYKQSERIKPQSLFKQGKTKGKPYNFNTKYANTPYPYFSKAI